MNLGIEEIVMGSDGNLLGIIGNLLEELCAFLWKYELIKCLIIVPLSITKTSVSKGTCPTANTYEAAYSL